MNRASTFRKQIRMVGMHGMKWGGGWSGGHVMGSVSVGTRIETVPSHQSCKSFELVQLPKRLLYARHHVKQNPRDTKVSGLLRGISMEQLKILSAQLCADIKNPCHRPWKWVGES